MQYYDEVIRCANKYVCIYCALVYVYRPYFYGISYTPLPPPPKPTPTPTPPPLRSNTLGNSIRFNIPIHPKSWFAGFEKPHTVLNFPQKNYLRMQKLGIERWNNHCPSTYEVI